METYSKKPALDYLETEITEYCNLNCKGCADFSNLAKEKKYYSIDEYKKDLSRLAQLFSNIFKIRLMGGEPLLNPDLSKYVIITKEIFPETDLRIVTNGLLIDTLSIETLQIIKKYNCKFDISNYPPTRKKLPTIKTILNQNSIEYDIGFPMNVFFKTILEKPAKSPVTSYNNCLFSHCHMMSHGKISPCSYAHCIGRFNEKYKTDYPETDTINMYSDITGEEIIKIFSKPHDFCRYCSRGMIPFVWRGGITSKKANKEDWLIKDSFISSTCAPIIQSALKKPAIMLRNIIQNK